MFQISSIDDIFEALLEEEEAVLEDCRTLTERMECIEQTGNILVICIDAIDRCRDESVLNTGTDLRWTQESLILSVLKKHVRLGISNVLSCRLVIFWIFDYNFRNPSLK